MISMRARLGVVVGAGLVGAAVLATSSLGHSLVYYKTPTEIAAHPPGPHARVRVGGLVVPGSVHTVATDVDFILSDGATDVAVVYHGQPPGVFAAGQGAVVEGAIGADRVLVSDFLVVKHSNEYRRADGSAYRPPATGAAAPAPVSAPGSVVAP